MIYKQRTKPYELVILDILDRRMELPPRFAKKLLNLGNGYTGEVELDPFSSSLGDQYLVLNDLRLPTADEETTFQIDTLVITPDALLVYEVKNYTGSYYYKNGRFFNSWNQERKNPYTQVNDACISLRQLLQKWKVTYEVQAVLVFINPSFMLYQAPMGESILLRGQLEAHFQSLRQRDGNRHPKQESLARKLIEMHVERYEHPKFPDYSFSSLKKGIRCAKCGSWKIKVQRRCCVCQTCGRKEATADALRRNIQEYQLLFPDSPITAKRMTEWCGFPSQQCVSRFLRGHYTLSGYTHRAFYE